jgi:hypothetical protein
VIKKEFQRAVPARCPLRLGTSRKGLTLTPSELKVKNKKKFLCRFETIKEEADVKKNVAHPEGLEPPTG